MSLIACHESLILFINYTLIRKSWKPLLLQSHRTFVYLQRNAAYNNKVISRADMPSCVHCWKDHPCMTTWKGKQNPSHRPNAQLKKMGAKSRDFFLSLNQLTGVNLAHMHFTIDWLWEGVVPPVHGFIIQTKILWYNQLANINCKSYIATQKWHWLSE